MSFVTHLECSVTGEHLDPGAVHGLSPAGKPVLVRYDLEAAGRSVDRFEVEARPADMWRWRELLPLADPTHAVTLGEEATPLIPLSKRGTDLGAGGVVVKDEGRLPTGSFKARGVAVAVSRARELGLKRLAMPTNGNAGAALAAYGSRAGMETFIFCPADTPEINVREMAAQGANVWRVDGLIDDCARLVTEGASEMGWFDLATLKEPYRVEGKKTMGFELAAQMDWVLPDVIFYPTGGGTGLIGMWKAFAELSALGWLEGTLPRMVAVQADGCAPIVEAFESGWDHARRWNDAHTIASGIRVPAAIGDFLMLEAIRDSEGFATAVTDEAILSSRAEIAERDGLLLCPEGAATVAAYEQALATGRVSVDERVVLFNCGNGLKYPLPSATQRLDREGPTDWSDLEPAKDLWST